MIDDSKKYLDALEEFKSLIIAFRHSPSREARSVIVKKLSFVRSIVARTKAGRTITIAPPPAVGGVILRDLDPFDLIFEDYHGVDIISVVLDCLDDAIGKIESGEYISVPVPDQQLKRPNMKEVKSSHNSLKESVKILGMSQEAFWPLLAAIIGATFYLGFRLGQAKFDSEKIDLYNSNRSNQIDIELLQKSLGKEQYLNRLLNDSLKYSQEQVHTILKYNTKHVKGN